MPGADRAAALRFAHQAIAAIANLAIPHQHAEKTGNVVTISVGVHVVNAERNVDVSLALIAEADKALYAAKKGGEKPGGGKSI
ncbi:hypothetical protein ABMA09_07355 [Erwinia rhapontici]